MQIMHYLYIEEWYRINYICTFIDSSKITAMRISHMNTSYPKSRGIRGLIVFLIIFGLIIGEPTNLLFKVKDK